MWREVAPPRWDIIGKECESVISVNGAKGSKARPVVIYGSAEARRRTVEAVEKMLGRRVGAEEQRDRKVEKVKQEGTTEVEEQLLVERRRRKEAEGLLMKERELRKQEEVKRTEAEQRLVKEQLVRIKEKKEREVDQKLVKVLGLLEHLKSMMTVMDKEIRSLQADSNL